MTAPQLKKPVHLTKEEDVSVNVGGSVGGEETDSENPASLTQPMIPTARQQADFEVIRFVAKLVLQILMQCWAISGAAILAILLLYWLYGGLLAFLLLCFAATGIIYHAGDRLLFHPDQPVHSRLFVPVPSMFNMPYDNIFFHAKDKVKLHAYFIRQPHPHFSKAATIIFLHGNAGNVGHRLGNARGLYHHLQCNILMVEYRGYGRSQGCPSEDGLYLDAQAAIDFLYSRSDVDHRKIIVFGRSLGGAVAIDLASRKEYGDKIACLLVENTFTSIPDIARVLFNVNALRYVPRWCYKNQFQSRWKIPRIQLPVLFISGVADGLIPPHMMVELYQLCSSSLKRLVQFVNGTHNETWMCSGYYHTINMFIDDVIFTHQGCPREKHPTQLAGVIVDRPHHIV